jgi:replicative DNA helicase
MSENPWDVEPENDGWFPPEDDGWFPPEDDGWFPPEDETERSVAAPRLPVGPTSVGVPGFENLRAVNLKHAKDAMMQRYRLAAEYPNAGREPCGIAELDRLVRFAPGTMTVLAGRQGSGKSALALQIARAIAHRGPVLYVLTEMSLEQVITRIVANTAHVEAWKVTNGAHPDLLRIVEETLDWLADQTDLTIVEAQMTPFKELVPRIRAFSQARGGVRAVMIDNLYGVSMSSRMLDRDGMGMIAKGCSVLAGDEQSGGVNAPIMLVHHLNREAAPNAQAKAAASGAKVAPGVENLGGSDHIGNWAHNVLILQRDPKDVTFVPNPFGGADFAQVSPTEGAPDDFTLAITKNRDGQPDIAVPLLFHGAQQRFTSVEGTARPFDIPVSVDTTRDDEYRRRELTLDPL